MNVRAAIIVAILCLAVGLSLGGGLPFPVLTQKATAATYVYEKDETAVPNEVRSALSTLNERGIVANEIDDDVIDGTGEIADQYKLAIPAARNAGLPALVVTSATAVIRVVKDPKTGQQVLEAVP